VSPQVWAWHASRIKDLKRVVSDMLVIFPFEEKIYRDAGLANTHFVGHPLIERIDEEKRSFTSRKDFALRYGLDPDRKWLLLLAGSRTEEVRRLLPPLSLAAQSFAKKFDYQTILVESSAIAPEHYSAYLRIPLKRFRHTDATHELMSHADLGLLKSGTTTLEAALLGLPGVICYRTHPLTFAIGKRLVKLPYIGLANIVLGQKLYPELLQNEVNETSIVAALEEVQQRSVSFRVALHGLEATLRLPGPTPSERVAQTLLEP
jgi:lipid-A-disaccharide synthase